MYTAEQCWNSIASEVRIIKHLASKIPAGKEEYKPSDSQRSTLELLQYLSAVGSSTLKTIVTENKETYKDYMDFRAGVTVENFAEKMDAQEAEMKEIFLSMKPEDFAKEFDFYGVRTKGEHVIEAVLKNFAAYRMQLFLYVRASGAHVFTSDLWRGVDTPAKS